MNRDEAIVHLDEDGYVVLEGALTSDQANELRARSAELIAEERVSRSAEEGRGKEIYLDGKSQRVWNLVNKGRIYEEMIQYPKVLELQQHLLGENFILSSFTVNLIGPGSPAGRLHCDAPLPDNPSAPFTANTIYVLDDFTRENGATWMVPGSYRRGCSPEPEKKYDDAIQLSARKGDIVVFHGATWHGSGAKSHRAGADDPAGLFLPLVYQAAARPVQTSAARGRRTSDADFEAASGVRFTAQHEDITVWWSDRFWTCFLSRRPPRSPNDPTNRLPGRYWRQAFCSPYSVISTAF